MIVVTAGGRYANVHMPLRFLTRYGGPRQLVCLLHSLHTKNLLVTVH
jgi:hypothetical protein